MQGTVGSSLSKTRKARPHERRAKKKPILQTKIKFAVLTIWC